MRSQSPPGTPFGLAAVKASNVIPKEFAMFEAVSPLMTVYVQVPVEFSGAKGAEVVVLKVVGVSI